MGFVEAFLESFLFKCSGACKPVPHCGIRGRIILRPLQWSLQASAAYGAASFFVSGHYHQRTSKAVSISI